MHCQYHLAQTWSLTHPCPMSFPWRHVAWFHCYKQEVPLVYICKCRWILHSVACHTLLSIRGHYGPNMTLFCPFFSTPSWWDRVLGHRRASVTLWISSASEHFGVKHHVLGMRPFSEASDQPRGQKRFHFLKSSLPSYSLSILLLPFRSIQDFWKWFQMILHFPKHWFWHQNHVSSMFRSWVTPQVKI